MLNDGNIASLFRENTPYFKRKIVSLQLKIIIMQTHHTLRKRMKIKKTALSGSLVAIAAAAAIMSSCSREVELINPNHYCPLKIFSISNNYKL